MKKIFLFAALFSFSIGAFAQSEPNFSLSDVKSKEDLNPAAKKAITYILSTPSDTTVQMRNEAEAYLMTWMEKTEDYTFAIDNVAAVLMEENKEEAFVFFAAMAEAMMNDKDMSPAKVNVAAAKRLVQYSTQSRNKLYPGAALTKMIEADKKGKLSEYINSISDIK